jgi:hypothetical protein
MSGSRGPGILGFPWEFADPKDFGRALVYAIEWRLPNGFEGGVPSLILVFPGGTTCYYSERKARQL